MGKVRWIGWVFLILWLFTICYAGGNPENGLITPVFVDPPPLPAATEHPPFVQEPSQKKSQAVDFQGEADWVYQASDWVLNLYITQKGSQRQGSHGILLFEGNEVMGNLGEIRALPIGTVQYKGPAHARSHAWDDSGWQMKDPLVKPRVQAPSQN